MIRFELEIEAGFWLAGFLVLGFSAFRVLGFVAAVAMVATVAVVAMATGATVFTKARADGRIN